MIETPDIRTESPRRRGSAFLLVSIGWITFFILWVLFILAWGDSTLQGVLTSGVTATTTGALLGIVVWKLTGRWDLPEQVGPGFVLRHAGAVLLFSLTWMVLGNLVAYTLAGESLKDIQWTLQVNSWRLFMGVWLYVIVAGISYAIRLRTRIQDERRKASRAEALAAEARMQSLRNQLHPHFLFNALHSVTALIRDDPDTAEDAMEQLGDLLRYAIRDGKQEFVSLEEEWSFTKDYIALQALRLGERMRVDIDLDPAAASCTVPALILQPLVENAILHGIAPRIEAGRLVLAARINGSLLKIDVTDDGPGPSGQSVRVSEDAVQDPGHRGNGRGLGVLRQRLDLLYGNRATFHIRKASSGGTHASLILPVSGEEGT